MKNYDFFENLLKCVITFLLLVVLILVSYLGINAAYYIKKTYLTYPESSVAQLELKVLNHEQRLRMIERWIVKNSKLSRRSK